MPGWRRVCEELLWKYRHQPERVVALLELDRDHFFERVRSVRAYARLWGISRRQAGQLVSEYEAARRSWGLQVVHEAGHERAAETPESLRKSAVGGPVADHNLRDRDSISGGRPVDAALGPPQGPRKSGGTDGRSSLAPKGENPTPPPGGAEHWAEMRRRAAHRQRCREGWKPSEADLRAVEDDLAETDERLRARRARLGEGD